MFHIEGVECLTTSEWIEKGHDPTQLIEQQADRIDALEAQVREHVCQACLDIDDAERRELRKAWSRC